MKKVLLSTFTGTEFNSFKQTRIESDTAQDVCVALCTAGHYGGCLHGQVGTPGHRGACAFLRSCRWRSGAVATQALAAASVFSAYCIYKNPVKVF